VGLGTILGSNVFNGLFTVGVASGITPIVAGLAEVIPALVRGVAAVAPTYPAQERHHRTPPGINVAGDVCGVPSGGPAGLVGIDAWCRAASRAPAIPRA
jgi:hypothetical protein